MQEIFILIILSATGFWLYTLILFAGIKLTNGVIGSLIIGCLPLTITMFGKPRLSAALFIGLIMILVSLLALLIPPLLSSGADRAVALADFSIGGVILLFLDLLMWTWFAVFNSRFLAMRPYIKPLDYSSVIGCISLLCMLPILGTINGFSSLMHHSGLGSFMFWCAVLGIGASWLANVFWAYSARNCPPSIGGALIAAETIFGVIYSLIYAQRLPHLNEFMSICCLTCGVFMVIKSQRHMQH